MRFYLKPGCLICVVACGFYCPSARQTVQGQDSPVTVQHAQGETETPNSSQATASETPNVDLDSFEGFFQLIGREDERNAYLVKLGKPTVPKTPLTRVAGISESEQEAVRAICTNGDNRIREYQSQDSAAAWAANENYNRDTVAKRDALMRQRPQLIEAIVVQLQQALGEKDFKKLTAYVYSLSPKTAIKTISSPGVTRLPPPQNDPNPEPAPMAPQQ
jgi:hypothetical protein